MDLGVEPLHGVKAIADTRSYPISQRCPQFNKSEINSRLRGTGIRYAFSGEALDARSGDMVCYVKGEVDFDKIRATNLSTEWLESLRRGAQDYRICLVCAERDPGDCHRTWLIAQMLHDAGEAIKHILVDGSVLSNDALLVRVAGVESGVGSPLCDDAEVLIAAACRKSMRFAHCVDGQEHGED